MKKIFLIGLVILTAAASNVSAQNGGFSFKCTKDTIVRLCPNDSFTLVAKVPNVKQFGADYEVNPISGASAQDCFIQYAQTNTPGNPVTIAIDDRYSAVYTLPFKFPFYGDPASPYDKLVVSTNGYLSFDVSTSGLFSHWSQTAGNIPNTAYDRSLVMGVFHDLDPSVTTSPTQQIKYDVVGTAPHRRFILSYYKVPLFSATCNSLIQNTHQIVLYESLGIIEVFVNDVQQCATWNQGRKMIGLQNFDKTKGIMAPGRTSTGPAWGNLGMNESWRFVPTSGASLLRKVELFDVNGNLLSRGDTTSITNGTLGVNFRNVHPAYDSGKYIIKSSYAPFDHPEFTSLDTASLIHGIDTVFITARYEPPVVVDLGNDTSIVLGRDIQLTPILTGGDSLTWSSEPLDITLTDLQSTSPLVKPEVTTMYTLAYKSTFGCKNADTLNVVVIPFCIKVRNAFSPNGDGINDKWKVYDGRFCFEKANVIVYNRYGTKVYENSDYQNQWNGSYKGNPLPDGTYYAVIEYTLTTGKKTVIKSDVTIIR